VDGQLTSVQNPRLVKIMKSDGRCNKAFTNLRRQAPLRGEIKVSAYDKLREKKKLCVLLCSSKILP
jgi:hypothetical protein